MKKFLFFFAALFIVFLGWYFCYYHLGIWINLSPDTAVTTFTRTDDTTIYVDTADGWEPFIVKGVDIGSGIPGEWSTDFAADEETYLRWFCEIQEMGANTIRIYTVQNPNFYKAFYEYNSNTDNPLYLLHGVWVNDYVQNSHRDAYDDDFFATFANDCKRMVNVIHGRCSLYAGEMGSAASGSFRYDISQWVIGYILGVEWEDVTVAYTDEMYKDAGAEFTSYQGTYFCSSADASPFEVMLAKIADSIVSYETNRYKTQRLIAFSNWPTTDPFTYPSDVSEFFMKCAQVDVEHIQSTPEFLSGQFASYHVYPYYPTYLSYVHDWASLGIESIDGFITNDGDLNTYRAYLTMLTNHHSMPVVISEFGVSTARGVAQIDENTNRNQGHMSEQDQGEALEECWEDILASNCAGGCIFSWQDEWFKRTWNTMYAVDLKRTPYWSDYQTNEQYFGLLSFDPGEETSICYVDGDVSEWSEADKVIQNDDMTLYMKYDEKFIYFRVNMPELNLSSDTLYLPIDTTQKSGAAYCSNYDIFFDRDVDFIIVIDGDNNSCVMVQERSESLRANYSLNCYGYDTYAVENQPARDSELFVPIRMLLQMSTIFNAEFGQGVTFETGLLTYGNANPSSADFNSLADFIAVGDNLEIKLPWQLLNFSDPSHMMIHDDYYENYGVESQQIHQMYVGVGTGEDTISLAEFALTGWGNHVSSHERLKSSYFIMQKCWLEG